MTDQERAERLAALRARSGTPDPQSAPAPQSNPPPRPTAQPQQEQQAAMAQPVTPTQGAAPAAPRVPAPRAKKAHAAGGTRWVVAGVSAAATVGMIGAMTASGIAAANAAAPEMITVVVTQAPTSVPASTQLVSDAGTMSAPTDTAPATPTYAVVAAEAPAATDSGGS